MAHPVATLRPSFVRIFYHSVLSAHVMNLPTNQWDANLGTGAQGGYLNHLAVEIDADTMVQAFAQTLQDLLPTTGELDNYVIFNYPTAEETFVPVAGNTLALVGSDATPGQNAATQKTFSFYDANFNTSKVVLLDGASDDIWVKKNLATANAFELALIAVWTDSDWAWSSRQNAQPTTLKSVTTTLNRRLRRKYNYA